MNETVNGTVIDKGIYFIDSVFSQITSKLIVAVIILLIGFIIGKLLGKLVQRLLGETGLDERAKKVFKVKIPFEEVIGLIVMYFIYLITILMALNHIGITSGLLNILSIIIMIVIAVAIFISIKDLIPNLIAGIIIHSKGFISQGDSVKIENIEGQVVEINMTETKVRTENGDMMNIPNSFITKRIVIKKNKKTVKKR